ncbi:MAG: hypothetical protein ACREVS_01735 [Burkholderiales bacterium]
MRCTRRLNQLGGECGEHCCVPLGSPDLDDEIPSLDPAERAQALKECPFKLIGIGSTSRPQQPDASR